jgi:antitoxin MazE
MRARIRKWGNSLALRIPKSFAEEVFLSDKSVVEIKVVQGKLVVASVPEPEISLEKLLSDVNNRNLHREVPVSSDTESEEG